MTAIFKRDFMGYFRSPVGYTFLGVFLGLAGIVFYSYNIQTLSGDLLSFLSQLTLLVMILCPVLTMRLICEDRAKKTDQLMLTCPVPLGSIVFGKYLAAACVLMIAIFLTNLYALVISLCGGTVYSGEWLTGYLGLTLQSLSFLALDLFVTCFTKSQVSGAVAAFGANFLLWMADLLADNISIPWIGTVLNSISLYGRYEIFQIGQFSFAGVLFYLSFIAVCLTASVRVLDARRFSRGGAA